MKNRWIGAAVVAGLQVSTAAASATECRIFGIENTSNGSQERARLFVATDLSQRSEVVGFARAVAEEMVAQLGLDFIDVFVTRASDGFDRQEHDSSTAIAWLRFNPESTPVIDGRVDLEVLEDATEIPIEEMWTKTRADVPREEYEAAELHSLADCNVAEAVAAYRDG